MEETLLPAEIKMDILLGHPGAVVRCKNEKEASQLLNYLKLNYPDKVSNWRAGRTDWAVYEEQTVYHVFWDHPERKMLYGSISGSVHGKIFEFEDLLCYVRDLPIEPSDMSLKSLFG